MFNNEPLSSKNKNLLGVHIVLLFSVFALVTFDGLKQVRAEWKKVDSCIYELNDEMGLSLLIDFSSTKEKDSFILTFPLDKEQTIKEPLDLVLRFTGHKELFLPVRRILKDVRFEKEKLLLSASFLMEDSVFYELSQKLSIEGMERLYSLDLEEEWPVILTQLKKCRQPSYHLPDRFFQQERFTDKQFLKFLATWLSIIGIQPLLFESEQQTEHQAKLLWRTETYQSLMLLSRYPLSETSKQSKEKERVAYSDWVQNIVFSQRQLCSGAFIHDLGPIEKVGRLTSIRAEIACSNKVGKTIASLLFLQWEDQNKEHYFRFIGFIEGEAKNGEKIINTRNQLFQAIIQ